MNKILTISIAAYNVDKYLEKTLSSLIIKNINKIEVLIQNDGSNDDTYKIAKKYADRYPGVFILNNKDNGGYGSTINESIKMASGKYFKQLDGDDWYETENLNRFVEYLENIDVDLVLSPFLEIYENSGHKKIINSNPNVSSGSNSIEKCDITDDILMHELTIKTSMLKENNISISENCFYTDNEYTFMPLSVSNTIARFDKPIYCYRLGVEGQSVSISGIRKHYKDTYVVAKKLYKQYSSLDLESIGKVKKTILYNKILKITDVLYNSYVLLDDSKFSKIKLKDIDLEIKSKYHNIYIMTNKIKKVKLLRTTDFKFYGIVKFVSKKKFK